MMSKEAFLTLLLLGRSLCAAAFDELCAQTFCNCADAAKTVHCRCESNKQASGGGERVPQPKVPQPTKIP